ncbi:hypothetical protein FHG66_05970 [Rubellimicrobium rubrum]|uniref:Uncharacterized protein n=1 Tax=Rubellimicrobium rubrum TaxID=2585369 RepID=A0A5C4MZC3_9RHOB|nr:hypothetical protein [Rubellimicrobium rubrum]TNC51098.1 hypothetical protein FHG66_05970 [Rubellimicrobium rubrum]
MASLMCTRIVEIAQSACDEIHICESWLYVTSLVAEAGALLAREAAQVSKVDLAEEVLLAQAVALAKLTVARLNPKRSGTPLLEELQAVYDRIEATRRAYEFRVGQDLETGARKASTTDGGVDPAVLERELPMAARKAAVAVHVFGTCRDIDTARSDYWDYMAILHRRRTRPKGHQRQRVRTRFE